MTSLLLGIVFGALVFAILASVWLLGYASGQRDAYDRELPY